MTVALPFHFDGQPVRVFERDGDPWFVARDVATVLGYADTDDAIRRHCKAAETLKPGETPGMVVPPRGVTIIPERDVYRLIMRSKLPAAERFEEWVVAEVLPAIRKTGRYAAPGVAASAEPDLAVLEHKIRLVGQARRAAGLESAKALWAELGLPVTPAGVPGPRATRGSAPRDKILELLREAGEEWVRWRALQHRARRCHAPELRSLIGTLIAEGVVEERVERRIGGGHPIRLFRLAHRNVIPLGRRP